MITSVLMMEMLGFMVVMVVLVGVVLLPLHIMEVDHTGVMEDMEEAMRMEPHMVMVVVAMEVSMDLVVMLMMVMVAWATIMLAVLDLVMVMFMVVVVLGEVVVVMVVVAVAILVGDTIRTAGDNSREIRKGRRIGTLGAIWI